MEKKSPLSGEDLVKKVNEWRIRVNRDEKGPDYSYIVDREENIATDPYYAYDSMKDVKTIHGESFVKKIIPELIRNNLGRKINILDVGAGTGLFKDQIKKIFGDKVRVYSTGLSKNMANLYRRKKGLDKLGNKDLKWRSILQLDRHEEFDLIIDTFGEFLYDKSRENNAIKELRIVQEYINAALSKLRKNGVLSIAPVRIGDLTFGRLLNNWLNSLKTSKRVKDLIISHSGAGGNRIRIIK